VAVDPRQGFGRQQAQNFHRLFEIHQAPIGAWWTRDTGPDAFAPLCGQKRGAMRASSADSADGLVVTPATRFF
jgi:hypothetical protein